MGKATSKLTMSYMKQEDLSSLDPVRQLKTVPQRLEYYANYCPEKQAIVFASTDGDRQAVNFKELYEKSLQVARALIKLGIKPKEYLAICLRPCPEWLYVTFGAMIARIRPFGAHFTYKDGSDFVATMHKLQTCTCMVMDPGYENENWNIMSKLIDDVSSDGTVTCKQIPSLNYLLAHKPGDVMEGVKMLSDLTCMCKDTDDIKLPEISEDDVAFLFKTSGSTGYPKLVSHSHCSLSGLLDYDADYVFNRDDIYFSDRPFEWIGGFPFSAMIGQTRITTSGFCKPPEDPARFAVDSIRKENCSIIVGLPPVLFEIVKRKDEFPRGWKPRGIITGGLPITKQIFSGFQSLSKYFIVAYASSESLVVHMNLVDDCDKFIDYDCGPPLPGAEVKVVDEMGNIVPIGTHGDIYIKNKRMFSGYVNDVEKTSAVLSSDGWYKTDDVGRMSENGSLFVEGRKSNTIISGGYKIIPEILENVMMKCPGVKGVVMVPVPDEKFYQVICACVMTKGSNVNENTLRKFCEELHGDKQGLFTVLPKFYLIVEDFPLASTGKVSRPALTELATKMFKEANLESNEG